MTLEKVMSSPVVTVQMDDTLDRIKEIFDEHGFHHLLVVDSRQLFGVISDRDLLRAISPKVGTAAETGRDTATLAKRAHQIMTREIVSLTADKEIFDALKLFREHKISCIPIVNEDCEPIGIVTWRDILMAMLEVLEAMKAKAGGK